MIIPHLDSVVVKCVRFIVIIMWSTIVITWLFGLDCDAEMNRMMLVILANVSRCVLYQIIMMSDICGYKICLRYFPACGYPLFGQLSSCEVSHLVVTYLFTMHILLLRLF